MQNLRNIFFSVLIIGCAHSAPNPELDNQGKGVLEGAALGAGSGAIIGAQVGALGGPAAALGAGFGAIAGSVKGISRDVVENNQIRLAEKTQSENDRARVLAVLAEQYNRRLELHPTREIYPADLFFFGDERTLKPFAEKILVELARMDKTRLPYSRLALTVYAKSNGKSEYAEHLCLERAEAIADIFAKNGIDPKRLEPRGVLIDQPILIDPYDDPDKYNQAVEIVPLDR